MPALEIFPVKAFRPTDMVEKFVFFRTFEQLLRAVFEGLNEVTRLTNDNTRKLRMEHEEASAVLSCKEHERKLEFVREYFKKFSVSAC